MLHSVNRDIFIRHMNTEIHYNPNELPFVLRNLQEFCFLSHKLRATVSIVYFDCMQLYDKDACFCVPKNRHNLYNDIVILKTLVVKIRTNCLYIIFKLHRFQ